MNECMVESTNHLIHPWHDRLEGLPEGKGNFYYWGPNYTVDPIVMTMEDIPKILLIRRRDNDKWALPGGFLDENESPIDAGRRELLEETGLKIDEVEPTIVYTGPVHDHRATVHAWPETIAMLWMVVSPSDVTAHDDAADAKWIPIDKLPNELHGSHKELIAKALQVL